MHKLVSIVTKVDKNVRHDDDIVDRMHHRYTVIILVVFTVFLGMAQYTGSPITCWMPKHFTGSHSKYTNSHCWIKNTYWLPFEEEIPKKHEDEKRHEVLYYQWVPFILLAQAAMFYAPHSIWRALNSKSGVDSDNILEVADKYDRANKEERRKTILTLITNQIDRFVSNPSSNASWSFSISKLFTKICCCVCGSRFGNYLVVLYIVTKFLYIANIFCQLFLLNAVLKTNYNLYGEEAIRNAMEERDFVNETIFPKVTMCDFEVRKLGNVQRYTVQCLLPINLYTEKVYAFLWFWMVFVLILSCLSIIIYIMRAIMGEDRLRWVRNHLKHHSRLGSQLERGLSKDFVYFYLKQDGVFILRMIAHNTNKITTGEVICAIWDSWRERRADLKLQDSPGTRFGNADTMPLKGKPPLPPKPAYPSAKPSAPSLDDVDNGHSHC